MGYHGSVMDYVSGGVNGVGEVKGGGGREAVRG